MDSLFYIAILIFSVIIHEVSHGYAALLLGDRTAEAEGRLTLNPLPHIDLFGSLLLPLVLILTHSPILLGWAKPVPFNPYNLRSQKWGPAIVGAAGPLANIVLAVIFGLFFRFVPAFVGGTNSAFLLNFTEIAGTIALLNLALAVFNFVPIPPLDGSKVLFAVLPYQWRGLQAILEQYGFFLLLIFIFFFAGWLAPLILFFFRLITGAPPIF